MSQSVAESRVRSVFGWIAAFGFALSLYVHFKLGCGVALREPRIDGWGAIVVAVPSVAIGVILFATSRWTSRLAAVLLVVTLPLTSVWLATLSVEGAEQRGQRYCNPG